jgi:hypothetical protein
MRHIDNVLEDMSELIIPKLRSIKITVKKNKNNFLSYMEDLKGL